MPGGSVAGGPVGGGPVPGGTANMTQLRQHDAYSPYSRLIYEGRKKLSAALRPTSYDGYVKITSNTLSQIKTKFRLEN